jgi:hypothetical protein
MTETYEQLRDSAIGELVLSRDSVNLEHLMGNETGVGFELH